MRLFKFIIIPLLLCITSNSLLSNDNNIGNDLHGVNTYYTTKKEDTLISIARKYDISFADILSANDVNMDISTISRVTNGKYVQMPWGIKELKTFFTVAIKMKDGNEVSNTILKKERNIRW